MTGTPEGLTESGFMEKPGIESATLGLQGIALIHYTTGASLPVHLMKAEILASKGQIMQFSFKYINKKSKLNQQTHSEANGKQVRLFAKKFIQVFSRIITVHYAIFSFTIE